MKQFNSIRLIIMVVLFANLSLFTQAQLNILSGSEGGTYNFLAHDIVNISSQPINVMATNGSMDNFRQINENPEMLIAFLQYDVLLANELIKPEIRKDIHVFYPLFLDEEIHLITRKDMKINSLEDLKGKKVGVGTPEEGTKVTAQTIKNKTGIMWRDIEMPTLECYKALMNGEIDAFFYVVGIPANNLFSLPDSANVKLVNITHKNLKDLYKQKTIPAGTYAWQLKPVTTFAVPTLLVLKVKDLSLENEKKVNQLLVDMKANVDKLQKEGHPKWKSVYFQNQEINWTYYFMRAKVE